MECYAYFLAITLQDDYCLIVQLLIIDKNSYMMVDMKHLIQDKINADQMDKKNWLIKEDTNWRIIKAEDTGKLPMRVHVIHPSTEQKFSHTNLTHCTGTRRLQVVFIKSRVKVKK